MTRRTCLITGTTHGIGQVTAAELAGLGFELVMLCRNSDRAGDLKDRLERETGNTHIDVIACDLGSLDSVRRAVEAFGQRCGALHLLINNAGTMLTTRQISDDGFERTFAVNYLGPYLLTRLLLPRLLEADKARIVNVASKVHFSGSIDLAALAPGAAATAAFRGMQAYADSKLGNVMFTLSLAERLPPHVTANCLHPGVVATNITGATNAFLRVGMKIAAPFMRTPAKGAQPTLHLALSEALEGVSGKYVDERLRTVAPAPAALEPASREALWRWSARACGLPEECCP